VLTITGYDLILDSDVTGIGDIEVIQGEEVQCTFTDKKPGPAFIKVTKETNEPTGELFVVTISSNDGGIITEPSSVSLASGGMHTFEVLSGHSYSVMETPSGSEFVETSNSCVNLMPETSDTANCTIVNTKGGLNTKGDKVDTLADLQAITITNNDKANDKLAKAINHVVKSLDDNLWFDNTHLDPKDGKKVFHEEEKAVKQLLKIKKESDKCKGITSMTLEYIGTDDGVFISVPGLAQIPNADHPFTAGVDDPLLIGDGITKFSSNTEIVISDADGVIDTFTIHTSCSQPIEEHDVHGDLTVDPDFVPMAPLDPPGKGSVEIDALTELDDGNGDPIPQTTIEALEDICDAFVAIDRELKDTAIMDATALALLNPSDKADKEIEKAMKEMNKGDDKRDDGKLDKAIHHYEKAWKHAQKAIKEATP
jgi:hypothetical protein